jgi:hypothetical protein
MIKKKSSNLTVVKDDPKYTINDYWHQPLMRLKSCTKLRPNLMIHSSR